MPTKGLKTFLSHKSVLHTLCVRMCVRLEMVTAVTGVSLCRFGLSWITADSIQLQTHTDTHTQILEDRRPSDVSIRLVHYNSDPLRKIWITGLLQHVCAAQISQQINTHLHTCCIKMS